jgi:hypothetical protein
MKAPSIHSPTSICTRLVPAAAALLLTLSLAAASAGAQGTLRGRVVDSETGLPIIGAQVQVRKAPAIKTDSTGVFVAADIPGGDAQVTITMLGFSPGQFKVHVNMGGVTEKVFSLDFTGQKLPQVVVQARAEQIMSRYSDFEARRQRGQGAFLRWDQLTDERFGSVGDALKSIRGVRMQCNQQTYECYAVMARSPQCKPVWVIDGMEAQMFHENTPIRDVYGIEIYRGPGEIPGEYSGSNAACGVIVMWTKSRPFRSTNP